MACSQDLYLLLVQSVELYSSIVVFAVYGETRGIWCETSKRVKNYMGSYDLNMIAPIVTGSGKAPTERSMR